MLVRLRRQLECWPSTRLSLALHSIIADGVILAERIMQQIGCRVACEVEITCPSYQTIFQIPNQSSFLPIYAVLCCKLTSSFPIISSWSQQYACEERHQACQGEIEDRRELSPSRVREPDPARSRDTGAIQKEAPAKEISL